MFIYEQETGRFYHAKLLSIGYAGHGEGINNGSLQHKRDVGPIPAGDWKIGANPISAPTVTTLTLEPEPATKTFGRSGFLIHGDSAGGTKAASRGCIVLPRHVRLQVAGATDKRLLVIGKPGFTEPGAPKPPK
jgi:hypothetical protein